MSGIATSIIAPNGDETVLHVDTNRNLSGVTFPDGTSQRFEYNTNDLMTAMIEPKGNRFEHEYDEHGRLITFNDENGGTWAYENIRNVTDRSHTLRQTMAEGSVREQYFKHNTNKTTTINEISAEGDEHNITRNATTTTILTCNTKTTTAPYGENGTSTTLSYLESPAWYGYDSGAYGYLHANDRIVQDVQKHYADENASQPQSVTYTTTLQTQPSYYAVSRTTTQTLDYTTNTLVQKSPAGRE